MAQIIQIPSAGAPPSRMSGLGDGLESIGKALFGGNEAQQALIREKALEAQRLNAGNLSFQDGLRNYGTTSPEELAARGVAAGQTGAGVGGFGRLIAATKFGATDPRTGAAQIAAGQGFGDTYGGVKMVNDTSRANNAATVAESGRQFDAQPTNVLDGQGQSTIVPRRQAYGRKAPEQLTVVQGNAARNALTAGGGQLPQSLNEPTREFIGAGPRGEAAPEIVRLQRERDALPVGSPRRTELDAAIRAKSISPGGEGIYDKTMAEAYAKTDIGLQNDASGSGQRTAMLDNIEGQIRTGKAVTGPGSQYVLALQQFGRMLGIPGIESTAPTELVRALGNKLTLDLSPNGSLGGQVSNTDRDFLMQTVPGMANSRDGNLALIGVMKRLEERKRQSAQWAAEYKAANGGRVDAGWSAFLAQKAQATPLFPQAAAPAGGRGLRAGHVEDGYEFVGGDPSSRSSWRPAR